MGTTGPWSEEARVSLGATPEDETPHLAAHFRYHAQHGHEDDDFTFVLDLILDGLGRAATD